MAELTTAKTSLAECEMSRTFEAVRAEALFASTLQPSGSTSPDQVRAAVATTLRRLGSSGCAARMAGEFGDHGHRGRQDVLGAGDDPQDLFAALK